MRSTARGDSLAGAASLASRRRPQSAGSLVGGDAACRQAIAEAESVGRAAARSRTPATRSTGRWSSLVVPMRRRTPGARSRSTSSSATPSTRPRCSTTSAGSPTGAGAGTTRSSSTPCGRGSERAGNPGDVACTDCNVGEILSDQGHLDEAAAHLQRARRVWSATGERQGVVVRRHAAGSAGGAARRSPRRGAAAQGSVADLRRFRMDAYARFRARPDRRGRGVRRRPSRALQIARQELVADERNRPMLERAAGFALARLGQLDEAEGALMRALAHADERGAITTPRRPSVRWTHSASPVLIATPAGRDTCPAQDQAAANASAGLARAYEGRVTGGPRTGPRLTLACRGLLVTPPGPAP